MKIRVKITPEWDNSGFSEWVTIKPGKAFKQRLITEDSNCTIQVKLKHVLTNDMLIDMLGINAWCVNEGLADGNDWIDANLQDCIDSGLITPHW